MTPPPGLPPAGGDSDRGEEPRAPRAAWGDGLRLAIGTLTLLPAGMPSRVDRVVGGRAMVLAPIVGVLLGGIAAGVVAVVQVVRPEADLLAAVLAVLVVVGLSGALHLDGLADFADALGSRRDREAMLRIMKQSDIGPFGVVAIVGILLVDVAALTSCIRAGFGWQAALIATTASRLTLPWSCRTTIPAARPDGLGAIVAATVRPLTAALSTIVVLAAALLLAWLSAPLTPPTGAPLTVDQILDRGSPDVLLLAGTTAAVLLAVATSLISTRRARTALGGTTGDVLGATVELALPITLLTLALTS